MEGVKPKDLSAKLERFYMSDLYPILICAVVAIGCITALELFFCTLFVLLTAGALVLCDSIKPFLISLCTAHMQISVKHSPFYPSRSDYFVTGWRFAYVLILMAVIAVALVYFIIKNRILQKISFKRTPLLLPLLILSASFLINGVFSSGWTASGLGFGAASAVIYLLPFVLVYHGFNEKEKSAELLRYVAYIAMLIALVIGAELIHLYLTNDNIFVGGSVNKVEVALGWGIWNLVGASLTVLIPVIFVGMNTGRHPWLYFASATLTYAMAVLTMSRNSLLFATLTYGACVIISCFKGKNKKAFRIIVLACAVIALALVIILWGKIKVLLGDYFERGFSDNGRFEIWTAAFENFLRAPVFGNGFKSLYVEDFYSFGPLPLLAHNTILQLLSAMGIVGLAAYGYYLIALFKPSFKNPTLGKSLVAMSLAVLNIQSLMDNFVFNFYPMLFASVASALVFKMTSKNDEMTSL